MEITTVFFCYLIILLTIYLLFTYGPSMRICVGCQFSFPYKLLIATIIGSIYLFITFSANYIPITPTTYPLMVFLFFLMYFGPIIALALVALNVVFK